MGRPSASNGQYGSVPLTAADEVVVKITFKKSRLLISKDISNIQSNLVAYGIWCNEDGMVIDDGTIFCFDKNHFRIFCAERNLNWFSDTATGFNVTVEDISPTIAALAFQGPLSCKILNLLKVENIENLKPFHFDLGMRWAPPLASPPNQSFAA